MKRHLFSVAVVLMVLSAAQTAERTRVETPQRRSDTTSVLQQISPEERAKMRERWQDMSPEEREQFRAQMRQRFDLLGRGPDSEGQMKAVDEQIAQLKSEQREYVDELKAIRDLALKEKAKDTAKRLEALIAKRQRTFQQRLRALEQRRSRLERIRGQRPGVQRDAVRGPGARKAPDFTLSSFDGKKVSLADYKGKIVVLEWLNFECPYSRYHYESAKTMIDLANKYKSRDVVWLAVNSTNHTTPGANKDFAGKYKLPYPILDDRPGKVGRSYKAQTTPHMFVIDRDGWIVYEGAIDNSAMGKAPEGKEPLNHVEEALQELIAGRQITTPKTKPYGCSVKYAG